MTNWKTTCAGVGTILAALADIATALGHGTITQNLTADIAAIIAGVGLILANDAK